MMCFFQVAKRAKARIDSTQTTDKGKVAKKRAIFFRPGKSATALELLRTMPTEDVFTPRTSFFLRFCSFLRQEQKLVYESFFTFALMWTLGGAVADARAQL